MQIFLIAAPDLSVVVVMLPTFVSASSGIVVVPVIVQACPLVVALVDYIADTVDIDSDMVA